MKISQDLTKALAASRLRIRTKSPFFTTLALFAQFKFTETLETAGTNGKDVLLNPAFFLSLTSSQKDGLILHELLHAALLHVSRRGLRDPELWNIAADIVVNGLIVEDNLFELPPGGIREPGWEYLSVEEIYELLEQEIKQFSLNPNQVDLLEESPMKEKGDKDEISLDSYWKNALQQATVIARIQNQGQLPQGLERQLEQLSEAQLDWRSYLWRYMVKTPNDFQGLDRRFISRRLYIDALQGESVQIFVAIDTSGSVDDSQMKLFLSELQGILNSYPHLECYLYYADADLYGPYLLTPSASLPTPKGGGGTSFVPFFEQVEKTKDINLEGVCIYLTDGYGDFPKTPPSLPVLWVVTPGGLENSHFPFGETVRLVKQ